MAIPDRLVISEEELRRHGPVSSLGQKAGALLAQQRETWDLARRGYAALDQVELRRFEIDGYPFILQHNPARMTSSTASVDDASIRNRRCFLCADHLPQGQKAVGVEDDWLLLVNPFPIFPQHFTVANIAHVPQQISQNLLPMLRIVRAMGPDYTLFYNGPRSGASAPDHMHFQVGNRDFMPVDKAAPGLLGRRGRRLAAGGALRLVSVSGVLRPFFSLESSREEAIAEALALITSVLPPSEASPEEPMLNIIARWENDWRVLLYPRLCHRPSFFFAEDPAKILISPAAVDMGGLTVAPRREDFAKITREDLERMFAEVCFDSEAFERVVDKLRARFDAAGLHTA